MSRWDAQKMADGKRCEGETLVFRRSLFSVRLVAAVLLTALVVPLFAPAWAADPDSGTSASGSASQAAVGTAAPATTTGAATSGAAAHAPAAAPAPTANPPLLPCPPYAGPLNAAPAAAFTPALTSAIRDRVHKRVGGVVTSVCRTPFGLYEVVVDAEIVYVDERVNYLLVGNAFDLRSEENVTALRKEAVTRIDFNDLPLQLAVKTVRGNGVRVLAVFEDPNCPYCRRFEKEIAGLTDATIYTFLYPILSRDASVADDSYPKSKSIWCAPDRSLAWSQLMLEGKRPAAAPDSCQHPLEEILALGQKLHINGTPTLVFTDGRRAPGAIPLERVEQMMSEAARSAAAVSQ
jgi:thiol:disulfide interchange protein DsbC